MATSLCIGFLAACSAGDQGSASNSSAAATAGEQGGSGDLRAGAAQGTSTEFATGAIARSGQTIDKDHTLTSANGLYELRPDADEWYVVEKQAPNGKRLLFGNKDKSYNKDTTWAVMQGDGNIVFLPYRPKGNASPPKTFLGTSQTENHPGAYLTMQDNGNVTVRRPKCGPETTDPVIWSWWDRCPSPGFCFPAEANTDDQGLCGDGVAQCASWMMCSSGHYCVLAGNWYSSYVAAHPDDGPEESPNAACGGLGGIGAPCGPGNICTATLKCGKSSKCE